MLLQINSLDTAFDMLTNIHLLNSEREGKTHLDDAVSESVAMEDPSSSAREALKKYGGFATPVVEMPEPYSGARFLMGRANQRCRLSVDLIPRDQGVYSYSSASIKRMLAQKYPGKDFVHVPSSQHCSGFVQDPDKRNIFVIYASGAMRRVSMGVEGAEEINFNESKPDGFGDFILNVRRLETFTNHLINALYRRYVDKNPWVEIVPEDFKIPINIA